MPRRSIMAFVGTIVVALAPAESARAQVQITSGAVEFRLTGRVHAQFATSSVDGEPFSDFFIRRARFTADVTINDFVSGRVQPDYGEGSVGLRDAYVQFTFSPEFRITAGQFKRPFDLFELTSSTQILVIERAGRISGLDDCQGIGGPCSFSRFTEELAFSDRDVGVKVEGEGGGGAVGYSLAITNGTGQNASDENGTKSYTGRVHVNATDDLRVALNLALHDFPNPVTGDDDNAFALGGDVEIGDFDEGLHVQAGGVVGRNWLNLDAAGDASTFAAFQAIVAFKSLTRANRRVSAVEPVGRLSWGDPDTNVSDNAGFLFTPGIVLHFIGRNKLAANLDVWAPAEGDAEWSMKVQSYLHF